jgi:hypothetical protein
MSRRFAALTAVVVIGLMPGLSACGDDDDGASVAGEGASVSALVMKAWETGDQADIDAVYAQDVRMILDQETVADNREEITSVISGAMGIGNTYEQIGPVTAYTGTDGDLYVGTLVEVVGPGHPQGDPLVGFYRVRDGEVIRHVFIEAGSY